MRAPISIGLGVSLFVLCVRLVYPSAGSDERRDQDWVAPVGYGYHAMVHDARARKIVLFGGQTGDFFTDPGKYLSSDTWTYDVVRGSWQRLAPSRHPPAMSAHAMAYDPRSGKIVVYGGGSLDRPWKDLTREGQDAYLLRQTWTFDSRRNTWTRASDGPPARYGHRMVAVPDGRIILFGGACVDAATGNNAKKLDEMWSYDPAADVWTRVRASAGPSPRHYFGMVYDTRARRVIVWGGAQKGRPDAASVWAYDVDANAWLERTPALGPKPLAYVAMAYDSRADKTVVYGGNLADTGDAVDDTWLYDYTANGWSKGAAPTAPGRLSRMPLVFAPEIGRTVLFGGQVDKQQFVYSDALWTYDALRGAWERARAR